MCFCGLDFGVTLGRVGGLNEVFSSGGEVVQGAWSYGYVRAKGGSRLEVSTGLDSRASNGTYKCAEDKIAWKEKAKVTSGMAEGGEGRRRIGEGGGRAGDRGRLGEGAGEGGE